MQFFPELLGAAAADEDYGHDPLLGDLVQVTLVCEVQDAVGILHN